MASMTAEEGVAALATAVNRGGRQADVADALGGEHGYLVNQLAYGFALGIMRKCRFALRGADEPVASCGSIMYPLATDPGEDAIARDDHPYHDGELTCNAVRGALVTLSGVGIHSNDWRAPLWWGWK